MGYLAHLDQVFYCFLFCIDWNLLGFTRFHQVSLGFHEFDLV